MNKKTTLLRVLVVASLGFTAPCAFTGNASSRGGVAQIVGSENGADGITLASGQIAPMGVTGVNHPQPMDVTGLSVRVMPISTVSTRSPHYGQGKTNNNFYIRGQTANMDWKNDPAGTHLLLSGFDWGDAVLSTSSGFNLWRGHAPSGTFASEFGNRVKWALVITNATGKFTANQVYFQIRSSFTGLNLDGNIAKNSSTGGEIPLQFILAGLDYGPDGIPGTADDIWYSSDTSPVSSSSPINALFAWGVTSSFGAASMADVTADRGVETGAGFFISCKYWVSPDGGATVLAEGSARLVTTASLTITALRIGGFQIALSGQSDIQYNLLSAPSLSGPWTTDSTAYASGVYVVYSGFEPGAKFFRLRQVP